jgi:RNAse (barnase) inhibitor barstar
MGLDKQQFTYLLEHPDTVRESTSGALQDILADYPWFQAARVVHTRALKKSGHFSYNNQLKITAAYTADLEVLFDFITTPVSTPPKIEQVVDEAFSKELELAKKTLHPNLFEPKEKSTTLAEEELQIDSPLAFTSEDRHSFDEWLKLTTAQPIVRTKEMNQEHFPEGKQKKFALIDRFIQSQAKLSPDRNYVADKKDLAEPFTQTNENLMTETLARVYVQQKNFQKAIQAYKILILKYPEKSGFFADQIRAIEKLLDKTT